MPGDQIAGLSTLHLLSLIGVSTKLPMGEAPLPPIESVAWDGSYP